MSTLIKGTGTPARIFYEGEGDTYKPVRGSRCEYEIKVQDPAVRDFLINMFGSADDMYRIRVYKNNELYWIGAVVHDFYFEQFNKLPFNAKVVAEDGLGRLQNIPFVGDDNAPLTGYASMIDIILICLNKLNLELPLITADAIRATIMDDTDPLDQGLIDMSVFVDRDGNPLSCYDVLEQILKKKGVTIRQAFAPIDTPIVEPEYFIATSAPGWKSSLTYPFHRGHGWHGAWFAKDYYWHFYAALDTDEGGTSVRWRYRTRHKDSVRWSDIKYLNGLAAVGNQAGGEWFYVNFDGTYFHFYCTSGTIETDGDRYYQRAEPQEDGTLSFSSTDFISSSDGYPLWYNCLINTDSGFPALLAMRRQFDGFTFQIHWTFWQSTTNDGTFTDNSPQEMLPAFATGGDRWGYGLMIDLGYDSIMIYRRNSVNYYRMLSDMVQTALPGTDPTDRDNLRYIILDDNTLLFNIASHVYKKSPDDAVEYVGSFPIDFVTSNHHYIVRIKDAIYLLGVYGQYIKARISEDGGETFGDEFNLFKFPTAISSAMFQNEKRGGNILTGGVQLVTDALLSIKYEGGLPIPSLDVDEPEYIDADTTTLNGEIVVNIDSEVVERGFILSKISRSYPGNVAPEETGYDIVIKETGSFDIETFQLSWSGMDYRDKYYIRSYAKNDYGYGYSIELEHTPISNLVAVNVMDPDAIDAVQEQPFINLFSGAGYEVEIVGDDDLDTYNVARAMCLFIRPQTSNGFTAHPHESILNGLPVHLICLNRYTAYNTLVMGSSSNSGTGRIYNHSIVAGTHAINNGISAGNQTIHNSNQPMGGLPGPDTVGAIAIAEWVVSGATPYGIIEKSASINGKIYSWVFWGGPTGNQLNTVGQSWFKNIPLYLKTII
jgi:hypothetical protein